jgi:phytoene desaturase
MGQERHRFRRHLFDQMGRIGYRDIESRVRYERIITPADWDTRYELSRATFNPL